METVVIIWNIQRTFIRRDAKVSGSRCLAAHVWGGVQSLSFRSALVFI